MKKLFWTVIAAVALVIVGIGTGSQANAGTYMFNNCLQYSVSKAPSNAAFSRSGCSLYANNNVTLQQGDTESLVYKAADGSTFTDPSPDHAFAQYAEPELLPAAHGVSGKYSLSAANGSNSYVFPYAGQDDPLAYPSIGDRQVFRATLKCEYAAGCPTGSGYTTHIEVAGWGSSPSYHLDINDFTLPSAAIDTGTLMNVGTVSGWRTLQGIGLDQQSGVAAIEPIINGHWGDPAYQACTPGRTNPCPTPFRSTWNLNTAIAPFVEGSNWVSMCAFDYAESGSPNVYCSPGQTITVHN